MVRAGLSLRGTSVALAVFAAFSASDPGVPSDAENHPCASTIRSWVLRLGYARLRAPLDRQARWAWLIDHTMQIGSTQLMVIVGVNLDEAPFGLRPLALADLHLVAMVAMNHSDQHKVAEQLHAATSRTGVPVQIVADGGTDLQKGIELFRQQHPEVISVPDLAHHAASCLKFYRDRDPRWTAFIRQMAQTGHQLRQSDWAHLMPPKLRNKARYMSVGSLVHFGHSILEQLGQRNPEAGLLDHYAWVGEYGDDLRAWEYQHRVIETTLRLVREQGLFGRASVELGLELMELGDPPNQAGVGLRNRMEAYVGRYSRGLRPGERLVGSTEILESAFGRQKRLSGDQSGSGLTGLSVGLGVLLGEYTPDQIKAHLEEVPEKRVLGWARRCFGKTVQWLRRRLFGSASKNTVAEPNMG